MSRARPWFEAFAPASVSNLGPGFDCLGLALRAKGDKVRARWREQPGADLLRVTGDGGKLPTGATNTAVVAVNALLRKHAPGAGVERELDKGLPLGSGLGSSGASAAAAVVAADAALELGLPPVALVEAAREGEAAACGAGHADNVAPSIIGGIVLIVALDPLRVVSLPVPPSLWFAIYTPGFSLPTADARAVLPRAVALPDVVQHAARLGQLVHALHIGDLALLGEAITDDIVEPARAPLIPGYLDAKAACCEAGALACSISGAGPTTFALASDRGRAEALVGLLDEAFAAAGVPGSGFVDQIGAGATITSDVLH
jgi:homoserine kinase